MPITQQIDITSDPNILSRTEIAQLMLMMSKGAFLVGASASLNENTAHLGVKQIRAGIEFLNGMGKFTGQTTLACTCQNILAPPGLIKRGSSSPVLFRVLFHSLCAYPDMLSTALHGSRTHAHTSEWYGIGLHHARRREPHGLLCIAGLCGPRIHVHICLDSSSIRVLDFRRDRSTQRAQALIERNDCSYLSMLGVLNLLLTLVLFTSLLLLMLLLMILIFRIPAFAYVPAAAPPALAPAAAYTSALASAADVLFSVSCLFFEAHCGYGHICSY